MIRIRTSTGSGAVMALVIALSPSCSCREAVQPTPTPAPTVTPAPFQPIDDWFQLSGLEFATTPLPGIDYNNDVDHAPDNCLVPLFDFLGTRLLTEIEANCLFAEGKPCPRFEVASEVDHVVGETLKGALENTLNRLIRSGTLTYVVHVVRRAADDDFEVTWWPAKFVNFSYVLDTVAAGASCGCVKLTSTPSNGDGYLQVGSAPLAIHLEYTEDSGAVLGTDRQVLRALRNRFPEALYNGSQPGDFQLGGVMTSEDVRELLQQAFSELPQEVQDRIEERIDSACSTRECLDLKTVVNGLGCLLKDGDAPDGISDGVHDFPIGFRATLDSLTEVDEALRSARCEPEGEATGACMRLVDPGAALRPEGGTEP